MTRVLLSEQDADSVAPDGWALRAERAVRASGRTWTIPRPSRFMQVFADPRSHLEQVAGSGRAMGRASSTIPTVVQSGRVIMVHPHALSSRVRKTASTGCPLPWSTRYRRAIE